jgi:RNA recognition motif-containing protein
VKITTKVRVREAKIKVPLRVESRRNLPRFGIAKSTDENVTTATRDFILMEHPADQLNEGDEVTRNVQAFRAEYKISDFDEESAGKEEEVAESKPGVYVPPSKKSGAGVSMSSDRDGTENTLRVSNLTKAVTEEDLRDLFERFGRIHRISLPRVEEKGVKVPRGFAYIAFARREDAETAMNRLQGYGYDHLIIKIEWAKPGTGMGGGGGGGMGSSYVSGYGKQLAQDTTEKVFFSSTKN